MITFLKIHTFASPSYPFKISFVKVARESCKIFYIEQNYKNTE